MLQLLALMGSGYLACLWLAINDMVMVTQHIICQPTTSLQIAFVANHEHQPPQHYSYHYPTDN